MKIKEIFNTNKIKILMLTKDGGKKEFRIDSKNEEFTFNEGKYKSPVDMTGCIITSFFCFTSIKYLYKEGICLPIDLNKIKFEKSDNKELTCYYISPTAIYDFASEQVLGFLVKNDDNTKKRQEKIITYTLGILVLNIIILITNFM